MTQDKEHTDASDNRVYVDRLKQLIEIVDLIDDKSTVAATEPIDYIAAYGTLRKDRLLIMDMIASLEHGTGLGAAALGRTVVEDMIFLRYLKASDDPERKDRFKYHPAIDHYLMFKAAEELGVHLDQDPKYEERFKKYEHLFRRPDGKTYWRNWAAKSFEEVIKDISDSDESGQASEVMKYAFNSYDNGSEVVHHNANLISLLAIDEGYSMAPMMKAFDGLRSAFLSYIDIIEIVINEERTKQNKAELYSAEQDRLTQIVQNYIAE